MSKNELLFQAVKKILTPREIKKALKRTKTECCGK